MVCVIKYSSIKLEVKKIVGMAEEAYFKLLTWNTGTSPWPLLILSLLAETLKAIFLQLMETSSAAAITMESNEYFWILGFTLFGFITW